MDKKQARLTKPRGWTGKKWDRYWRKSTAYGTRSMCSDCGHEALGWACDTDRKWHRADCPRIQGTRREWKAYVDATGRACVHRLTVEREGCYFTREEALLALASELRAQYSTIQQQLDQVAVLLLESEKGAE